MASVLQIQPGTKLRMALDVPIGQEPSFSLVCTFVKPLDSASFLISIPMKDGNMDATIIGVEAVDLALARLIPVVEKENAILVVTADHGNADEMLEKNKKGVVSVRTAHSLNPVPFIIFNADVEIADGKFGLSNVAATVAKLMGFAPDPHWDAPIIK